MKKNFTLYAAFLSLLISFSLFAQSGVGKLSGKVVDADTKEPMVGANVIVEGTSLGAATNINGEYFVLNLNPGTYVVKVSYVGYAPKTLTGIRIVAGITYELNIDLTTDFSLPEVVVSDKKFFEEKSTNTTKVYDAEQIGKLPVKGVENLASLNAGVVAADGSGGTSGNASINVRGGRGGEVLYIVDGVAQNDLYTGANYSQVSNNAIEQISFEIGGFEAKYGQAQSGVVNVTTKSGTAKYNFFADALTSSFTDKHGYNLYAANLGGPIIPGNDKNTFFLSAERGWFQDGDPRSLGLNFPNTGVSSEVLPNTNASVWRFSGRTSHRIGDISLRLGANVNTRQYNAYVHSYAKQNSEHNPLIKRSNLSFSGKFSYNISANSYLNLNLGTKIYNNEQGDGVWFNNLAAYGDSAANAAIGITLPGNGQTIPFDANGMFAARGRVSNGYFKTNNLSYTGDLDFTSQVKNHLLEAGGGFNYSTLRYYSIGPRGLASDNIRNLDEAEKYRRLQPTAFGFDNTGQIKTAKGDANEPKNPLVGYAFLQDRFELSDMVLNIGVRFDYFDTQADILKNPALPFSGGTDPNGYDAGDFKKKDPEMYFSPRIGLGFPVTASTVFHAQYGKFVQQPSLDQIYTTIYNLNFLITDNNWSLNTGQVNSEVTTSYEVGFRQIINNQASLNITASYKNTEGLVNTATTFFQRSTGGQVLKYITPTNTDFGTIKGVSIALDISRVSYFDFNIDYTYSIAEGTGSSTSSSFTAAFRNVTGEIPKVIAPLDFDQRHTGVINVDFNVPKGDLGIFEQLSATVLFRFNSGRPYTPLASQNLIVGTSNYGDTKGYVNSAYGPGNFRIDLKVEKSFTMGSAIITPYLWIENLLNAENPINVYQSTGDPYTTGWLNTLEGKKVAESTVNPSSYRADYTALERNPFNFGIPRLIKLGVKVNFANISF